MGVDVQIQIFLTSALVGGEWSNSRPCRFIPRERPPGTHWIGGWVGLRAGLDDLERRKFLTLPGLELRHHGRPARSYSLYRLRYPGSPCKLLFIPNLYTNFTDVSIILSTLGGSLFTTAWRVLRLRMEETASRYGE
jgi:hypothetical protein